MGYTNREIWQTRQVAVYFVSDKKEEAGVQNTKDGKSIAKPLTKNFFRFIF